MRNLNFFPSWVLPAFCFVLTSKDNSVQINHRISGLGKKEIPDSLNYFPADNLNIQYTGRIDFSNPRLPRFWAPGVYIRAAFEGSSCDIVLHDEVLYGDSHNYIEIVVDDKDPLRIQTTGKENRITAARGLEAGRHTLTICKDTESGIGYLEFAGLYCEKLLDPGPKPLRKIECIGNSITCGSAANLSPIPCGMGKWYDQHDAYMSYGARTARLLQAQWLLTAVSGIGLIHSCCNMNISMPQVFNKVNQRNDSLLWDFKNYEPDVVTICLGQNDGILDSSLFCSRYIAFIQQVREHYPRASIFCLNSPMADERLNSVLKNYITGIVRYIQYNGEKKVYSFFFSKRYHHGCGDHPDLDEHRQIAEELSPFIRKMMDW
jgi:hypothetical protein